MKEIAVEWTFSAPIDRVFEVLADHEGYQGRIPGCKSVRLIETGYPERNGLGAIRAITSLGGVWFHEKITKFDPPHRYDYQIVDSTLPIEHEGGAICLTTVPGGTHVRWTTALRITTPLVGPVMTYLFRRVLTSGFRTTLRVAEKYARTDGRT